MALLDEVTAAVYERIRSKFINELKLYKTIAPSHYLLTKSNPQIATIKFEKNTTTTTSSTTPEIAAILDLITRIDNVTTSMMAII